MQFWRLQNAWPWMAASEGGHDVGESSAQFHITVVIPVKAGTYPSIC
jgi:hypothetical protein